MPQDKKRDRYMRGAEKRDVVINSYLPIDRMPMTLGQCGPVYYVPEKEGERGYIPKAFDYENTR